MSLASDLYGRAASWRRAWYAGRPERRRRLQRPVISVGNLAVGGRGKTPLVATIARWLLEQGERPAILSRGYARRDAVDGVLVVSDAARVIEPVERSGDEPQMLARALPGVPVLVSADRYLAGVLAERTFGVTVHLLDDGFQHLALARDVDLLIVNPSDLEDKVLPSGRLREPLSAAAAASLVIGTGTFQLATSVGAARALYPFGDPFPGAPGGAVAVSGIARPERFFAAAREQGWDVVKEMSFRDHHWFTAADVTAMTSAARGAGADTILTTEKDAVRLAPLFFEGRRSPGGAEVAGDLRPSVAFLPIAVTVEPQEQFFAFLHDRLAAARAGSERATL